MQEMRVKKRNGEFQEIAFDKILNRVKNLANEANITGMNFSALVMKVIDQLYDNIETTKIDELTAEQCASLVAQHPDFGILAGRVVISNHHKNTKTSFSEIVANLYNATDIHGNHLPLIDLNIHNLIQKHKQIYDDMVDYNRDFLIDYFGFKTLERAYLMKINGQVVERPQHMWLRVAVCIHKDNFPKVKETYDLMSLKYFTHATPTLYNAGTPRPQLSSCFLLAMDDDSIEGIYTTLKDCAKISKWAGGIGLHIHNIRASGSHIRGTNGASNGIVPMLRVFNNTARYVDQCITPDTYIYTTTGPIPIQDCINKETMVFNGYEQPEVIHNILEHSYNGDIVEINTMHSITPLQITDEHPILVLQNQHKTLNYNVIQNRLDKKLCSFKWITSKELTLNDMLVFPIPNYEKDYPDLSCEDCYLYGVLLGDGYMNNNSNYGHITVHSINKKHIIDFTKLYFEQRFIQYDIKEDGNLTRIRWNRSVNLPFHYSDIYDSNKIKRLHYRWMNLPLEKSRFILKGLIDSDGCIGKEIVFDNTSRNLIETCRYLCLRMGVLTSGYVRNRVGEHHQTSNGIIINRKISYSLRIPKTKEICSLLNISECDKFFKFIKYNNYLLTRIKSIQTKKYDGILYDLQMKKNHNYLTHNGIIHNGGGKRNGSFAIYLEPWHADVENFLDMKKNHGDEEMRARDLFYALWIPDLFMQRVKDDEKWTLFCPDECPGLADVYGYQFEKLYGKYEEANKGKKTIKARELWLKILDSQMETGTPYLLYKDACNRKSNQQNLGTIKSSNLCTEIIEYSNKNETAVCNLASIALSNFVEHQRFNYTKLHEVTKVVAANLDKVIDINYYPTAKTKRSNLLHRPIGIGVQGLADVYALMDIPYHSDDAKKVNNLIFETIYHAALETSNELAYSRSETMQQVIKTYHAGDWQFSNGNTGEIYHIADIDNQNVLFSYLYECRPIVEEVNNLTNNLAGAYSSFMGSPASQGILQFDMWNIAPSSGRYDWDKLKENIIRYGLRNSLSVAPMPTASTSQILGNNECFEPFTSNIYTRRTIAGEFIVANKYLMRELIALNLWNDDIKNNIIANKGSIQQIDIIPEYIRNKYKIVWEIPMKHMIDMARDRGAYICQSQSLNLWLEDPNYNSLTSMHFYSWQQGLKTAIYYLRRKAAHQPQQFTIEPEKGENGETCDMCGS